MHLPKQKEGYVYAHSKDNKWGEFKIVAAYYSKWSVETPTTATWIPLPSKQEITLEIKAQ